MRARACVRVRACAWVRACVRACVCVRVRRQVGAVALLAARRGPARCPGLTRRPEAPARGRAARHRPASCAGADKARWADRPGGDSAGDTPPPALERRGKQGKNAAMNDLKRERREREARERGDSEASIGVSEEA
jgi:hypothetical protein